jgi:serine/threonine protein kinase
MTSTTSNPNRAESAETELKPGAWLDRYELLAPVATGGFGSVWFGRLRGVRGFEKLVAIKVPKLNGDNSFSEMLLDEARIASAIEHDNVAKIIELGEQGDILFIVMEWIDGEPVSTLLRALDKTKAKFPLPVALKIISDMCQAAHAAHELKGADGADLGVVHRDISPQNMLITAAGNVKLIDFGIAKAKDRAAGDTTDGTLKGKIKYMAPEQALGRNVDRRTDVFALGAVLYRFLVGHAPYEAENEVATIHKLATGTPAPPLPDTFPQGVRNIVARALSLVPTARFKSALDMHRAIDDLGLSADPASVAAFVEIHLQERLAKRKAAIDIALRAAADRTQQVAEFPAPLSSRDGVSGSGNRQGEWSGGPPSGNSSTAGGHSHSVALPLTESSNLSNFTGPQLPYSPPAKPLKWLWALAVAVGAIGVAMIVLVATRKPPPAVAVAATPSALPVPEVKASAPPEPVVSVSAEPPPVAAKSAPSTVRPAKPSPPPPVVVAKPKPRPAGSAKPSGAPDFGY